MSKLPTSLYIGGNSFLSFSSSTLAADFFNRFGVFSKQTYTIINSIFNRIFVEFSFKLPFNNLLSKFKNRIHFLLYYLFFEVLVSQKPRILVRRERLNLSFFKNKRELKKAKESIGIKSFSFNVSLSGADQISNFLTIIGFFVAPYTNKKLNPPSKFVPISVSESFYDSTKGEENSVKNIKGLVKNLSIFPNYNTIDDLSGIGVGLNINILPFKLSLKKNKPNSNAILYFLGSAYGLSFLNLNYINLRFFKF